MPDLVAAVDTTLSQCLAVRAGEEVLIVVDPPRRAIGEALREGAQRCGADAVLMMMDERGADGNEPPAAVAAAMSACDVFIAPTTRSLSHTVARRSATESGARGATMPGATEEMLARVMAIDFALMAERSRTVSGMLHRAASAYVTCPRGTDLTLDLSGRTGAVDDGDLTAPGAFGNLPAGEGFISPLSGSGAVVPASLAGIGLAAPRPTLTVGEGQLRGADGAVGERFIELLEPYGELGTNLAELGVGTNAAARLTGNVLEDEKILGTVHVAFGASAGIGGNVAVPIHLDVVIEDATLTIDGRTVLDAGRYVLDQP